jgi:hypothetical protein
VRRPSDRCPASDQFLISCTEPESYSGCAPTIRQSGCPASDQFFSMKFKMVAIVLFGCYASRSQVPEGELINGLSRPAEG